MRYAATVTLIVALSSVLVGCPREPDDTGDDTSDTDTGDTDDSDTGDTSDSDTSDTSDTGDTDTGDTNTGTDRDLIITEVVDGDLFSAEDDTNSQNGPFDRVPRFVEITNVGGTTENLSGYTLALWRNGGINSQGVLEMEAIALSGTLAPNESYVVSIESELSGPGVTGFFQVYGFEPDLTAEQSGPNGDDGFAIYYGAATGDGSNAQLIDVYGVIGTDGTGQPWEYIDGYACRTFNASVNPTTTFTVGEWTIAKDLLRVGSAYADNIPEQRLVIGYTSPGEWDANSCPPPGPECSTAGDCDAPANPCMEAVCTPRGECDEQPAPGLLTDDAPGDCSQPSCDATGVLGTTNVDDPPADTFCVHNTCGEDGLAGEVVPVPQNVGLALPTGQTPFDCEEIVCLADGGTGPANANDPLEDVTFCSANICTDGEHDSTPRNVGLKLPDVPEYPGDPAQEPGDCQSFVCDTDGTVAADTVDDNDDEPDQTECIDWTCTEGVPDPSNTVAPGTSLPDDEQIEYDCARRYCDDEALVQTELFVDDKPADTACTTYTCVTQEEPPEVTQLGNETVLADAVPGNCHETVCDGTGGTTDTTVVNVDDPAPDEVCAFSTCNPDGSPGDPLPFDPGDECNGEDGVCNAVGTCVECVDDEQCDGGLGTCDLETNACQPYVVSTTPDLDALDVLVDTDIVIEFSAPMDPESVTFQALPGACTGSVQLSFDGFESCTGFATATWSEGDTVVTLVTSADLVHDQFYELLVTTDVFTAAGAALGADYTDLVFITETFTGTCAEGVVISQVYAGGGNSGSVYTHDFVELFNRGDVPVNVTGWTLQYTSAAGNDWDISGAPTVLSGTIDPGEYFLVQQAQGMGGTTALPTPDGSGVLAMGATAGKVALVSNSTMIGVVTCPTGPEIVDFVGFGTTANCFKGAGRAPAPSATNSVVRRLSGCQNENDNALDFVATPAVPRNSSSPTATCTCESDALANGLGVSTVESDYCALEPLAVPPLTRTATRNTATATIEGRIYEAGMTNGQLGVVASIKAQLGYGALGSDPRAQVDWVFFDAPFSSEDGDNDVYVGSIVAPVVPSATPTDFAYALRFSVDNGATWTYCDQDGSGSDTAIEDLAFTPDKLGKLTVTP